MSPRPGGEADKFGNRYEGAWTVQHVLRVLSGAADSITVEDIDDLARGAEFTFRHGESVQVHQLKRQNGSANSWTPTSLQGKGIWEDARAHVEAGRRFHFVSMVPARPLQELADRARRSFDLASFVKNWLTGELGGPFGELASTAIFGSAEVAWTVLRGFWIEWPDEQNIIDMNAALAGLLLEGGKYSVIP